MANLYLFVDESGNFDFSRNGTAYFILSAIVTTDPIQGAEDLLRVRHHILAGGAGNPTVRKPRDCTHFHCSEDDQYTRNQVFGVITGLNFVAYAVVIQKNKTNPSIRDLDTFYQRAFKALVPFIIRRHGTGHEIDIFVSTIKLKSKASAIIAGLKAVLKAERGVGQYRLHFHPNHSHHMLQVSDYVCWAIARKWEANDRRSHVLVAAKVGAEFDMFQHGTTTYY